MNPAPRELPIDIIELEGIFEFFDEADSRNFDESVS